MAGAPRATRSVLRRDRLARHARSGGGLRFTCLVCQESMFVEDMTWDRSAGSDLNIAGEP